MDLDLVRDRQASMNIAHRSWRTKGWISNSKSWQRRCENYEAWALLWELRYRRLVDEHRDAAEVLARLHRAEDRLGVDRSPYEYHDYLYSDAWQEKRRGALERAEGRCQVCNSDKRLDVHHRTYERLFDEADADLTVLCRDCHSRHHVR